MSHGRLAGVISFASTSRPSFDDETLAFFATVAQFLSTAKGRLAVEVALRANESELERKVEVRTGELMVAEEALRQSSPMKAKGVGEFGICGVGVAVANAIYNATGIRVRDYPITLDKLLAHMPDAA